MFFIEALHGMLTYILADQVLAKGIWCKMAL